MIKPVCAVSLVMIFMVEHTDFACEICGSHFDYVHCKFVCQKCGFRLDCSDHS